VHLKDKTDSLMDVCTVSIEVNLLGTCAHLAGRCGCVANVTVTGKTDLGGFGRAAVVEAPICALPRPEALRERAGRGAPWMMGRQEL
jgi:hypothetical protein